MTYQVISEHAAVEIVVDSAPHFVPWVGAGVSREAGILTSDGICRELAEEYLARASNRAKADGKSELTEEEKEHLLATELKWHERSTLYSRLLARSRPNPAQRVKYFRELVRGKPPAFSHYALAILLRNKVLAPVCITTNFDKLIERAFSAIGEAECQAIRTDMEIDYITGSEEQFYTLKIHGDYDTHNIRNTAEEITAIPHRMGEQLYSRLDGNGMLVLGSAGHEHSISSFFEGLCDPKRANARTLEFGLLWGVHIGDGRLENSDTAIAKVREIVNNGAIGSRIVELMTRHAELDRIFAFFPIQGSGEFLFKVLNDPKCSHLLPSAEAYLDSEIRLRRLLGKNRLPDDAIERHLSNLRRARDRLKRSARRLPGGNWIAIDSTVGCATSIGLCYGDLSDAELLLRGKQGKAAILTPDDIFISVGGGAALAVVEASQRPREIARDISKFTPVDPGDVVVTSAGQLPVEYIMHGASLNVTPEGKFVSSSEIVKRTLYEAIFRCAVLRIDTLFVPLLATGAGGLGFDESLRAMLDGCKSFNSARPFLKVIFVVWDEGDLPRATFARIIEQHIDQ